MGVETKPVEQSAGFLRSGIDTDRQHDVWDAQHVSNGSFVFSTVVERLCHALWPRTLAGTNRHVCVYPPIHNSAPVSHFLRSIEATTAVEPGATLHGLRVSFAAEHGRDGNASDSEVAALLGDRSDRMGKHYTRHVTNESKVIGVFDRRKKP